MSTLRFFHGQDRLLEHRLRAGRTTIGRADSCDIALPGDTISRTHCIIEGRGEEWWLVDRSRHGVVVDGRPAQERTALRQGSEITIGSYRVIFGLPPQEERPTAPLMPDQGHEVVCAAEDGRLQVERAHLLVVSGPGAGRRFPLRQVRVSVGSRGSMVELPDGGLVSEHLWMRLSRGRAMVEPGRGAVWLDAHRVRDITPVYPDEELRLGQTILKLEQGVEPESSQITRFGDMVAESTRMRQLFGSLRRMAGHHYTVLVLGESGVGKELVARGIHEHSQRAEKRFIAINCGAITDGLFESELFGHEKGAFTGAERQKNGAFHDADGGTLFLDEVGELPEGSQAKLLRALETGEVRRVGSNDVSYPDVRIVAATNRDLLTEVSAGRFREDLYFRLSVLAVRVPPLRERPEDLELLCRHVCRQLGPEVRLSPEALELIRQHGWPGNVRELRNVLTRAFVIGGPLIHTESLSFHQLPPPPPAPTAPPVDEAERSYLMAVLRRHGDNRSSAARELGISRSTLHYKLRRFGLS